MDGDEQVDVQRAKTDDLPDILLLQKVAYQSEATLVGDFSIPPLMQTLESIADDYKSGFILKAVVQNSIVGSVRGKINGSTVYIGRLIVHPDFQNKGIGTRLLLSVEEYYPLMRYELFTSNLSKKNLMLYKKNGYTEFKREKFSDKFDFIHLYKQGEDKRRKSK